MKIEICLTEREIARDFFRSLRKKKLEERFFYWFPLSVVAWLKLCESKAYRNYSRSLALAQIVAGKLARKIQAPSVKWLSLGSGQGTKEIPFLKALLKAKKPLRYFPLDSSQPLLEMAVAEGIKRKIPTTGFKANFELPGHLGQIPKPEEGEVQVASLLGNTLGNLGSNHLLKTLMGRMRRGDWLVVDGEIFQGEKTLAGYDHTLNRRFALAPLLSVGMTPEDGVLRFELGRPNPDGVARLSKSFLFKRDKEIFHSGERLSFRKGQILRMSPSYKYQSAGMKSILERGRAFRVQEFYKSPDGGFGLWLAERT